MTQTSSIRGNRRAALRGLLGAAAALSVPMAVRAQQPVTLKFATALPPGHPIIAYTEPWIKSINDAAQGEFQIQLVPGPTFANPTNVWERTVAGVADMSTVLMQLAARPTPKTLVSSLPLTGDDCEACGVALWRMYEKGLLADEFTDLKLIAICGAPANYLLSKQPIGKLEDLKGVKVRAGDKNSSDALSALGASPIAVPFSEAYQALSRGVVATTVANAHMLSSFRLGEVAKHITTSVTLGMAPNAIVMNKQSYAKLTPKGRAILDRFVSEESSRILGRQHKVHAAGILNDLRTKGEHTFYEWSPQEIARCEKALEGVKAAWMANTPDGKRVYETYVAEYASALRGGK